MAVAMQGPSSRSALPEFAEFWASRSPELRDRLVVRHMPLVRQIAQQFARMAGQRDDLEQVGYVGMIKAVERFDPAFGVPFDAYARTVVSGEISHYLRDLAPALRVPRWYRTLSRQLTISQERLVGRLGREPAIEELANEMNVTPEGVREILRLRDAYSLSSLSEVGGAQIEAIKSRRYQAFQLPAEDRIALDRAIERLAEVERRIIHWFFYQDLTQTEIAKRLGFSQKHVSRKLASTLKKLHDDLL